MMKVHVLPHLALSSKSMMTHLQTLSPLLGMLPISQHWDLSNRSWSTLLQLPQTKKCPTNKWVITMCTTDTINMVKCLRLLWVLLDSSSTVSLIKRTALPQKVITKTISMTWNVTNLARKIRARKVDTLRELRLPDKNVSSFTMIISSVTSSWVLISWQKQKLHSITQKETWIGLIVPSHLAYLAVWPPWTLMP